LTLAPDSTNHAIAATLRGCSITSVIAEPVRTSPKTNPFHRVESARCTSGPRGSNLGEHGQSQSEDAR